MTRIIVGVVSFVFLGLYIAWRWKRAGDHMQAGAAYAQIADQYFEAMKSDPRWQALYGQIQQRYSLSFDHHGADPSAYVVHHIALVDDQGFTYRIDNPSGPTRVVALVVRKQPAAQLYLSMDLASGALREDPAPYGWTYTGPPR